MLHPSVVILICFAGMVCVAPVAFYLCWLATVNRRERPTVVNGAWDFAGVLAALSGFLIIGGILLLGIVQNDPRLFTRGNFQQLQGVFERQWLYWLTVFAGYTGIIGLMAVSGIRRRAKWLSVYNVDADTAEDAIEQALKQAALPATRYGNVWSDQRKLVQMVPFHGTCHVTIHILVPHLQQQAEIERHLRAHFRLGPSPDNPAAGWISALAGGSVLTVVLLVALMMYILYVRL